ncbi:hypothetical protein BH23ACT9_BH23ACT9_28590 [soil metagenome]
MRPRAEIALLLRSVADEQRDVLLITHDRRERGQRLPARLTLAGPMVRRAVLVGGQAAMTDISGWDAMLAAVAETVAEVTATDQASMVPYSGHHVRGACDR